MTKIDIFPVANLRNLLAPLTLPRHRQGARFGARGWLRRCRQPAARQQGGQMARETVLVTGAAGFIGMHVARRLLAEGFPVVGLDNLNAYYDPRLKEDRLEQLSAFSNFRFEKLDLADREGLAALFATLQFPYVVHLAAQAGVRHSLVDPHAYVDSNLTGFVNLIEGCRHTGCRHLVYASSSSVYGANTRMPFSTGDNVDHPVSLYGATKKANELIAHAYSHLYALPATGLRFFTVYGAWGRPDMAMWLFADAIMAGRPIRLFNHGRMRRDFTFIADVSEAVVRLVTLPPAPDATWSGDRPDPASSSAPWRVFNIGNNRPVEVTEVVRLLEEAIGKTAKRELLPMQPGDVPETYADIADLERAVGFRPKTPIADGVRQFVEWFRGYRKT
jgi:UDP-glucuronate 4-epimerase